MVGVGRRGSEVVCGVGGEGTVRWCVVWEEG